MPETITTQEPHNRFTRFLRRLAEYHARALSGDAQAQRVLDQYGGLEWAGHRPDDALRVAELEVGVTPR